ncbi:hypothetical protein BP5796_09088 [Coleophoma crateriformis]|uniref:3'-5' exonuclease domain-containing protein n=1 Tax=Coleophoma crateriformis TaxID=565419 RepID=A0A3D8R3E6_9HELO|nr:hypothetical protein BP5796_09088 [Coleophoma crateriformis]
MTSFGGSSALAWDALRSTLEALRLRRPLSTDARLQTATPRERLWNPKHGIVFLQNPVSAPRTLSTAATSDVEQEALLHSLAGDVYDLAKTSETCASEGTVKGSTTATEEGVPQDNHATENKSFEVLAGGGVSQQHSEPSIETRSEARSQVVSELPSPEDDAQREVPLSDLRFKISEDRFRKAKDAEYGTSDSYWSYAHYRGPEGEQQKVTVHYCRTKHTTERCLRYFADQKLIGFDIEWKPEASRAQGPKKSVSLIQIASEERIALFHIALFAKDEVDDLVAPTLKKIMEDPAITKVGVAIKADCTRLRKFLNIEAQGIFELSHLYKLIKYSESKRYNLINKRLVSLAQQVQEHLHLPMFKGEVRSSDWSQVLAMDQIVYAASDSYAGLQLYSTMNLKRLALDPTPPLPHHAERNLPIQLADGVTLDTDTNPDELEPEDATTPSARLSSKYLATAVETLELDPDFDINTPSTPTTRKAKPSTSSSKTARSPIVLAATALAEEYRSTHPKCRAQPSSLRAYYIWHEHAHLSIDEIAALLREVPLQRSTVINYVLDTIKLEKLPFHTQRLREVLNFIPKDVAVSRYKTLMKALQAREKAEETAEVNRDLEARPGEGNE